MNRRAVIRRLRRQRVGWQVATLLLVALLLAGSGAAALTGSRLIINANNSEGDKVLVRVDGQDVFKICHDGAGTNVTIDPGTGGTVTINEATVNGGTGGGSGLPSGTIVYSNNPNDTALLAAGYTRAPYVDQAAGVGNLTGANVPAARNEHSMVWTDSELIVWGGHDGADYLGDGARGDPATGQWTAISSTNAPSARGLHSAVWTGSHMVVWSGKGGAGILDDGAAYDPDLDQWTAISSLNAPVGRETHTTIWTGSEMIVWGGKDSSGTRLDDGARYDPVQNQWTPLPASPLTARESHSAVWTGTEMIVWGGRTSSGAVNDGAIYDLGSNSWSPLGIAAGSAPVPRNLHTAVWTGDSMIVWGGRTTAGTPNDLNSGGVYNLATETWSATATSGVPAARRFHSAVWTGTEMIVWGGLTGTSSSGDGGRYDPATNVWAAVAMESAPTARQLHTAVWSGDVKFVWGGISSGTHVNDGGQYVAALNKWGVPVFAYQAP